MPKYVISYKNTGSGIYSGYDIIKASSEELAIETARSMWVINWNLAFPHKPNGDEVVKGIEFICTDIAGCSTAQFVEFQRRAYANGR